MSLGKLALGVASVVIGLQGLSSGITSIRQATQGAPPRPRPPNLPDPRLPPQRRIATPRRRQSGDLGLATTPSGALPAADVLATHMRTAQVRSLPERVRYIQGRILKGSTDPQIYTIARQIVSKRCGDDWCIKEKDNVGEAKAIFEYMRKNVRYTSDSLNIDTFQNPILTTRLHTGDCDDYSATTCALLLSIGIPCRLKVIQTTDSPQPNHIFAQAGFPRSSPSKWLSMDSSVKVPFGWEVPDSAVAKAWVFKPLP